ncbi:TonB-dependent receptor domain-containing protein [Altererythrobacter sp. MF3-039]|uniref:TonB-dependent receptor domain-containing protein n=1 Tax=Altererythrobacter sp. MF3-039 TaxID=3252901 RepID=UPI00390CB01D
MTGSRVRRDNFDTASQINVFTREDAVLAGATSTADILQGSTVTSGTSQINGSFLGFVSEGGTAAATVGLRGFGAARTLTLLNGRRLAPAGVGPELVTADLNVLPSAIINRTEVLREGASSIYGSDAIAGVINIITDKKIDGVSLDFFTDQPIAHGGGGRTYRGSVVAGKTFDRGYVTLSAEYRERTGMKLSDRSAFGECPRDLYFDPATGEEVGSRDFFNQDAGLMCFPYTANGGVGTASGYGFAFSFDTFVFDRRTWDLNGNVTPVNGLDRVGPNPVQFQQDVLAPVKTYTGYLAAGYEIGALGDAELYTEALFTRRESSYSFTRQLSIDFGQVDPDIEIYGGSYAGFPLSAFGYPTSPFFPNALADNQYNLFVPFIQPDRLTKSIQEVDFFRWNGGLTGNLGLGDWRYDANLQYSKTEGFQSQRQVTLSRLNNALKTALAPAGTPSELIVVAPDYSEGAGGSYTCASNVDAGGAFIAGSTCVPFNLYDIGTFQNGAIPANQYNYLWQEDESNTEFEQLTFSIILDGSLIDIPGGGTVGVALGYEHREDEINAVPSIDAQTSNLYNFSSSGITAGKDKLDEVFGEIVIPLVVDKPFARLLQVEASGRYTKYRSFGSDFTYNVKGQWAPNDFIRFRASYNTSFRAPNLFEQFVADQTGFFPSGVDPCSEFGTRFNPGDPIYDNCLSELAPILGNAAALAFTATAGPEVTTKGNVSTLDAETSRAYSVGGILTVPVGGSDLSFAVDYWDLKVRGEINTLGTLILSRCYESTDFPNAAECDLIAPRLPASDSQRGNLDRFDNPYLNVSQRAAVGIDFDGRLVSPVAGGELVLRARGTRMIDQIYQRFAENEPFDFNGTLGSQGFGAGPKWVGDFTARYTFPNEKFVINYGVNYVGSQNSEVFAYGEDVDFRRTAPFLGEVDVDLVAEEYWEHGISFQYRWEDVAQITLGMNNIFNAKPPTISSCPSSACQYTRIGNRFLSSAYDIVGRSVFLNVTRSF